MKWKGVCYSKGSLIQNEKGFVNPKTALVVSQVYAATDFFFFINKANLIFKWINLWNNEPFSIFGFTNLRNTKPPFYFRINEHGKGRLTNAWRLLLRQLLQCLTMLQVTPILILILILALPQTKNPITNLTPPLCAGDIITGAIVASPAWHSLEIEQNQLTVLNIIHVYILLQ